MNVRSELFAIIDQLGDEEQRVLLYQAWRLHLGQQRYGKLNLAEDTRDFLNELEQEMGDAWNYPIFNAFQALLKRRKTTP